MVKRTGPTNYQVLQLIHELKAKARQNSFWSCVAEDLQKPTRERRIVNVYKIDKYAQDGETILVPGKVLSVGTINKKVNVAAMSFSSEAKQKITQAKGKVLSIEELFQTNPEGKNVRIIG